MQDVRPVNEAEGRPVLHTDRLILRRFTVADITDYLAIFSHPEVTAFIPGVETRAEAMRQMAMLEGHWPLVGMAMFAAEERASGRVIGRVGPWMPDETPEPEIGWTIHPDYGRQGFATEAAQCSLDYIFDRFPDLPRVIHHIDERNIASQRTAMKLGAVLTDEVYVHPIAGPLQIWATYRS